MTILGFNYIKVSNKFKNKNVFNKIKITKHQMKRCEIVTCDKTKRNRRTKLRVTLQLQLHHHIENIRVESQAREN